MSSTSASPSVIDRNSSRDGNNENGNENESGRETDATGADASDEVTIETNNVVLLRNYNNDDGDGDGDGGVIQNELVFLNHTNKKVAGGNHKVLIHSVKVCALDSSGVSFATLSNEIF
ncbi:hypothetical protein FRACYDRAFT_244704 [Fragilariopsis cylindrus CCMP1102]|uniref:Uncharacterized protein n=1 Tax=Fragilariopsis cylindrus CCMP1102 TaxID=635003 RepID=A0A1E7F0C4_9STRA|nr:hypothetical protein FRACYDRAFT_244704 [Fragilariopsis cylindrus CCMP1102]|eukprot:OEU11587.1 hypothetical protein FRACYDRAFT_244704 [Fragilariopsis cylindrus CCMP1102]